MGLLFFLLLSMPMLGEDEQAGLSGLTLEQLLKVEVTSVNKREQRLDRSAAAVYVITQSDIRRSGATSIPEVLRLAPGLHVARISSETWAITARGFNGSFSNKLLVMVDGRSVYTPVFSGVWWDLIDVMMDDIDRIEVIRGPAGAIWGANAVNGVINIITKRAEQTQGSVAAFSTGNEDPVVGRFRYGGLLGNRGSYRVYGQYANRVQRSPVPQFEDSYWGMASMGFRADWQRGSNQEISLTASSFYVPGWRFQNNSYPAWIPSAANRDSNTGHGGHVLGKWTLNHRSGAQTSVQAYLDRTTKFIYDAETRVTTGDFEVQHRRIWKSKNEVTLGGGYRVIGDGFSGDTTTTLSPGPKTWGIGHVSAVNDYSIIPDKLVATLGARVEFNSFSGWNAQPTARLWYSPWRRQAIWLAVSRAVRTPSRAEVNVRRIWPAAQFGLRGKAGMPAESLHAWEVGYRHQWNRFAVDLAAFRDRYRRIRTVELQGFSYESGSPILWSELGDLGNVGTWGGESVLTFEASAAWRLTGSYTGFWMKRQLRPGSNDPLFLGLDRDSPRHQWQGHSMYQISPKMDLDIGAYYYGLMTRQAIAGFSSRTTLPARIRVDVRWARRFSEGGEWNVGVRNLLGDRSWEYLVDPSSAPMGMRRTFYTGVTWRF